MRLSKENYDEILRTIITDVFICDSIRTEEFEHASMVI